MINLEKGTPLSLTDLDGNRYERIITGIHYPATLNGEDCVIILLKPDES
jgi:hypothetical protein